MASDYFVTVGVDPSVNSTGVCVYRYSGGRSEVVEYYCIGADCRGSKPSKSTIEFYNGNGIKFVDYGKNPDRPVEYSERELVKTDNLVNSAWCLREVLESVSEKLGGINCVVMEGVSYGSVSGSSLVDLAGLNYLYREKILEVCRNLVIASPMEIKKFAVGNGGVDKDIMIRVWSKCESIPVPDNCKAKIDDIADAYFMSLYGMCKCCPEFGESINIPEIDFQYVRNTSIRKKSKKTDPETDKIVENFLEI